MKSIKHSIFSVALARGVTGGLSALAKGGFRYSGGSLPSAFMLSGNGVSK